MDTITETITTTAARELTGLLRGNALQIDVRGDRGLGFGPSVAVRPAGNVPATTMHNSMIATDTVHAIAYVAAKSAAPPRGEPR